MFAWSITWNNSKPKRLKAMSGPNKSYDPVEVAALDPAALEAAVSEALAAFAAADSLASLKSARLAHQGDASALSLANREIGALPPTARAEAGKRVGMARGRVARALAERQSELEVERDARLLVEEAVDVTAPVSRRRLGARHPLELISERVGDIFIAMGWEIAEGPEVESEWFNFDALNLGVDHPARQMQGTFFVDPPDAGLVLRTHTSPVQVRSLLERELPLYIVCPGKVFRTDELDATHSAVFHQVEGLFGQGLETRLRPSYFPFTEPSAELDFRCFICGGLDERCRTCGGTGWIEWGGCGVGNRNVLKACGIDPDRYTGFAFGMGIERALMLRHGVKDMREMVEGDVRFSTQFGMEI